MVNRISFEVISIHAPREGSDKNWVAGRVTFRISIHAPREGSDWVRNHLFPDLEISIHAPREGSDRQKRPMFPGGSGFQSTLPVRGATGGLHRLPGVVQISIHAPREGSDPLTGVPSALAPHFNPRSP